MMYYKVYVGSDFLSVGTSLDLRKYQKKHNVMLICDETEAQFIQIEDDFYRDTWMLSADGAAVTYTIASVISISKKEYDALFEAKETERTIEPEPIGVEEETEPDPTIEYVREMKIKQMSDACNKAIISGFDVVLSDGNSHHFSLTLEDQINIMDINTRKDETTPIYLHADGEEMKTYSLGDAMLIYDEYYKTKTEHIRYFNELKSYINSLDTINDISAVYYGIKISD